jgi:predicted nucleic acid-binding protein
MVMQTGQPTLRLLVDTNVILDVILDRAPWGADGARLLDAISRGRAHGFVAGHAVTTIHYIVAREVGRAKANTAVADVLQILTVVAAGAAEFQRALAMGLSDFEDAVQAATCLTAGAEYLVTRNARDFKGAPVATRTPGEILGALA